VASHPNVQGVFLFEETPSTRLTEGYESSGPAACEKEEVLEGYQRVVDLAPAMKTRNEVAVKECLLEVETLIETFRETHRFFLHLGE